MSDITLELDIPPGINSDDTTFGAKGRWANGNNVRFRNGRPETIGRVVHILGKSTAASPRTLFAYSTDPALSLIPSIVIGCDAALYSSNGAPTQLIDITPMGFYGSSNWAFASWGYTLLAAPVGAGLYEHSGTGVATAVTEAPAAMSHMLVTPQRQVMAIGCNEVVSGTFNPMCVRLSDIEDYSSAGSWTPTSTNNADEIILEGDGKLVAGRIVGAYVALWTNAALYLGQYIGDPGQTYRFDRVARGCGLIGPGAAAIVGATVYWMSPDHRFYVWSPGAIPEQLPCPVSRDIQSNSSAALIGSRTQAACNSAFNEVWWFYPDNRASGGNRYVAVNVGEGTWFQGDLDRRAVYEADFLYAPTISNPSLRAWRPFITVDGNGKVYSHEVEAFGGSGSSIDGEGEVGFSSFIQSADQYLNSGRQRIMISGIDPDFQQQLCPVDITVYLRDRPQSAAVTKGPYSLATTTNKKDFRASGMLISVKFSLTTNIGINLTESWRLGKPVFRGVTMGGR